VCGVVSGGACALADKEMSGRLADRFVPLCDHQDIDWINRDTGTIDSYYDHALFKVAASLVFT
jgi:hypothetical protein